MILFILFLATSLNIEKDLACQETLKVSFTVIIWVLRTLLVLIQKPITILNLVKRHLLINGTGSSMT